MHNGSLDSENDDAPLHAPVERLQPEDENHLAAVALNYFAYNVINVHSTIRTSPAMAAGVTDRLFDVADLVALLIDSEKRAA